MRIYFLNVLLVFYVSCIQAQSGYFQGPVELGLSGAAACYPEAVQPLEYPAQLGSVRCSSIGIKYFNRYMLPELSSSSINSQWIAGRGAFGISGGYFGSYLYSQSELGLAYGQKLGRNSFGGVALHYQEMKEESSKEHHRRITGNLGYSTYLSDMVILALNYRNVNSWTENQAEYPTTLSLGFAAFETRNYYASLELNYSSFEKISCSLGLEYWLVKFMALRAGASVGDNSTYGFGLSFLYERIHFDLGFKQHTWLGLSSAVGLTYSIGQHE